MTIQALTIRLSDGIKTGDYAPPKVYELTAILHENPTEGDVQAAVDLIKRQGDRFLGRAPAPAAEVTPAPEEPKTTRTRKPKEPEAPPAEDASKVTLPFEGVKTEQQLLTESQDPALAEAQAKLEAPLQDPLAGTEPPKQISDVELNEAVAKRRGALGEAAVPKLRELVETFNPEKGKPFVIRQIKQEDRARFLEQLAAIKV